MPVIKKEIYHPLRNFTDLDPLLERIGESKYVLLGEATHGTHEFYTWRTAITKRLIQEKGFNFIAVEGDWPDCYRINRFVKNYPDQPEDPIDVLKTFHRWPTWMWANWEIAALMLWLRDFNLENKENQNRIGFYGLDVYSLWDSLDVIINFLEKEDPETAKIAKKAIRCFEPYQKEGELYARLSATIENTCKEPILKMLKEIAKNAARYDADPEAPLNMKQNALVTANAELYYSKMLFFGNESWNIRDKHMYETLEKLLEFHGPDAKAIVWEHNTHIGDARATNMAKSGVLNVGQLVREHKGRKDTVLVGFGTYEGTVIAGSEWGDPMQEMIVPSATPGSAEEKLHSVSEENQLIIFENSLEPWYREVVPHRAIGVVYDPDHERRGNYVPTILGKRYDGFLFIDRTTALHPIFLKPHGDRIPETFPFGL